MLDSAIKIVSLCTMGCAITLMSIIAFAVIRDEFCKPKTGGHFYFGHIEQQLREMDAERKRQ
jgi:hypothetical protein